LSLSAGKIAHASFLISRQVDALKESGNLLGRKRLPALKRPVRDVVGDGAGKKIRRLHNHADTLPQLLRRQLAVVLSIEPNDAARRLVEPVQQAQEGCFPRPAGADDGKNFANLYLDADIVYEDFSGDDPG